MNYKVIIYTFQLLIIFNNLAIGMDIFHIPPPSPSAGDPITFEVTITNETEIVEAFFLYRAYGQQSYNEIEMVFSGSTWGTTILDVKKERGIEYFFSFINKDRSVIRSPEVNSGETPYVLSITPLPNDNMELIHSRDNTFLIISPEENKVIYPNDLLIMVSLYNIPKIDTSTIRIYLDEEDITLQSVITSDIITYAPQYIHPGIKQLKLIASTYNGEIISNKKIISINRYKKPSPYQKNFSYSANGRSEISLNQVDNENLNIFQTNMTVDGHWSNFKFKSKLKITSEESKFKQPKNRYFATIKSGELFKINLGDFTPLISQYTINGKRIRGFGAELRWKWLEFQYAHGELARAMQGTYDTDYSYAVSDIYISENGKTIYELDRKGYTFKNDISSYRLAFNVDNRIIVGSTLMKAKNNINSVDRILEDANFTVPIESSFPSSSQLDSGIYSFTEFHNYIMNNEGQYSYELSEKDWGGNKPQQNLVVGTDFKFIGNKNKFFIEGYWAISFLNRNIWDGPMSLAEMDTLMGDELDGKIFGLVDTSSVPNPTDLANYITINSNLVPILPIDYNLFKDNKIKAIMNMPSTAYALKFQSLDFNNFLEIQYSQVGPEFFSLANPYFPNNIREFSIVDKIWLLNKRLHSTFNYKYKTDEILETNTNPYNETTYGINLNYIPGIELPSTIYGHQITTRKNSITGIDTLSTVDQHGADSLYYFDQRINFITKNNLLTFNIPIKSEYVSYFFGGTFNSIISEDHLAHSRVSGFTSQESDMQYIALILGANYTKGLKLSLNISNLINNHATQGENRLNGLSITGGYPIIRDKMNISSTLSYLASAGISKFSHYGLSFRSRMKISDTLRLQLAASIKARNTSEGTETSNLAVKISTNYIF